MRLSEAQAKQLFAAHGIAIPRGEPWRGDPAPWWPGGAVVKAQTLAGGRGLRGGVRVCRTRPQVAAAARDLLGSQLGDETVDELLVEELVDVRRELYLALTIDRESGTLRLLLGREGGVDVERSSAGVASLSFPLDRQPDDTALGRLMDEAAVDDLDPRLFAGVVRALWTLFLDLDAELVEVNPLACTPDGRLVALDGRVIFDDSAAFRQPGRPLGRSLGTRFERACGDLGAVGVEMDGDIVLVVSGAGLMMATVDLVTQTGGRVRAAVDLGGLVLREADELAALVDLVGSLRPAAVLVNAFFQLATCDALARGLARGLERTTLDVPMVVRMRGRGWGEAHQLLEPHGVIEETDLATACERVVSLARVA